MIRSARWWWVAVAWMGVGLAGCGGGDSVAQPPSATSSPSATSAPSSSLTPPASDPASSQPPSSTRPTPPAATISTPGRAAPSVVRHQGFGAISLPGVKLTTSRGSATLDRVGVAGYFVEVCATGDQPVEIKPAQFSLTSLDAEQIMPQVAKDGYAPALKATSVAPGSCASGYVTFDLSQAQSDAYLLSWQGAAAKAVWSFNG